MKRKEKALQLAEREAFLENRDKLTEALAQKFLVSETFRLTIYYQ